MAVGLIARRRAVLRAWIRVLVPILVVGHLLSVLHFALVRHTLCVEHGELEHSDVAGQHGEIHGVFAKEPLEVSRGVEPVATEMVAHSDHEHCSLWFDTQRNSALIPPSHRVVAEVSLSLVDAPCEASNLIHAGPEILQLAPKQSPPV
jgi:hypothetical protein